MANYIYFILFILLIMTIRNYNKSDEKKKLHMINSRKC